MEQLAEKNLLAKIFSNLCSRDIYRCVQVNSMFRDAIDNNRHILGTQFFSLKIRRVNDGLSLLLEQGAYRKTIKIDDSTIDLAEVGDGVAISLLRDRGERIPKQIPKTFPIKNELDGFREVIRLIMFRTGLLELMLFFNDSHPIKQSELQCILDCVRETKSTTLRFTFECVPMCETLAEIYKQLQAPWLTIFEQNVCDWLRLMSTKRSIVACQCNDFTPEQAEQVLKAWVFNELKFVQVTLSKFDSRPCSANFDEILRICRSQSWLSVELQKDNESIKLVRNAGDKPVVVTMGNV